MLFLLFALAASAPIVETQFGQINGVFVGHGARAFLGVPFATPPVGALRFAPPVAWRQQYPPAGWNGARTRAACMQNKGQAIFDISEDCLYLDIYTPRSATKDSQLPVMLYLFGGSFTDGAGSFIAYNGTNLAEQFQVVVITINYRVGAFGFAAFEGVQGRSANYGLMDQQEALKWVQGSIGAFGGDPSRVMLFGESAGAISVMIHMVLPSSKGLFHAALSESGLPLAYTWEVTRNLTDKLGDILHCSHGDLACMRKPTAHAVLQAQQKMKVSEATVNTHGVFFPTIDGVFMAEHPGALVRDERFPSTDVALIAGTNTNESNLFVYDQHPLHLSASGLKVDLVNMLSAAGGSVPDAMVEAILKRYPPTDKDNRKLCGGLFTDASFLTGTRFMAAKYSQAQMRANSSAGTYVYRFDHTPTLPVPGLGVYHFSEVPFVWNIKPILKESYMNFSHEIGHYWTRFAATGDPNSDDLPAWPRYDPATRCSVVLNTLISEECAYRERFTSFWETFPPYV